MVRLLRCGLLRRRATAIGRGRLRRPRDVALSTPGPSESAAHAAILPALAGFVAALLAAPEGTSRLGFGAVVGVSIALLSRAAFACRSLVELLPFVRLLMPFAVPAIGVGLMAAMRASGMPDGLGDLGVVVIVGASSGAIGLIDWRRRQARRRRPCRVGVVGSAAQARELAYELRAPHAAPYVVVGHIGIEPGARGSEDDPIHLGALHETADIVRRRRLDLLLLSAGTPRLALFETLAQVCVDVPVRAMELTAFYEEVTGHVPLAAINAAWFQCVVHPRYVRTPWGKRVADVTGALAVLAIAAPLIALLAILVRRDGGPAFYRQVRIGEHGRAFTMLKLRSMRAAEAVPARWSSADDERVTTVGRFLRASHLDELPQVLNVLRGDMSIVGPRPEQPEIVAHLEEAIPFYSRRHLARPGITGWAQVHCGYAGSEMGSAWKLSHDLYYLRHRSAALDLMIVVETLRILFAARSQYAAAPQTTTFLLPEQVSAILERASS